jgi:hypothetical protein
MRTADFRIASEHATDQPLDLTGKADEVDRRNRLQNATPPLKVHYSGVRNHNKNHRATTDCSVLLIRRFLLDQRLNFSNKIG